MDSNDTNYMSALSRPLSADEIEFRAGTITPSGWAVLLAYKTARTDMARLDEAFGVMGWEREHKSIDGKLFCGITVRLPDGSAVTKWDAGDDVSDSGVKGLASDSFKRAATNFGIGRDLYSMPAIIVKLREEEFFVFEQGGKQKARQTNKFRPNEWQWTIEWEADKNGGHVVTNMLGHQYKHGTRFDLNSRGY